MEQSKNVLENVYKLPRHLGNSVAKVPMEQCKNVLENFYELPRPLQKTSKFYQLCLRIDDNNCEKTDLAERHL